MLQTRVRLLRSVLPPSAQGKTWCASHQPGGVSHPGKVQPLSRAARIASCRGVACRCSVASAIDFAFSVMRWKNTVPLRPSSAARSIGKSASAPVVARPFPSARFSAVAVTTRANGAPLPTRPISVWEISVEKRSYMRFCTVSCSSEVSANVPSARTPQPRGFSEPVPDSCGFTSAGSGRSDASPASTLPKSSSICSPSTRRSSSGPPSRPVGF